MADFYGTANGALVYHAEHGNAAWTPLEEEAEIALLRGSQYVDGRYRRLYPSGAWGTMFPGAKTGGRAQSREWPRTDATDYAGREIPASEIPVEVIEATYEAALRELVLPGSLSPDYVPADRVTKEKVGSLEITYADAVMANGQRVPSRPIVTVIDEIIAPVLIGTIVGSGAFVV